MSYGVTTALDRLEVMLKQLDQGVQFLFGGGERERHMSGSLVIWEIERGLPQAVYVRPEPDTDAFAADMVQIRARCHGGFAKAADKNPRRVEYDLSEVLVARLRWCVVRAWNGAFEEEAWEVVQTEQPGEAGCPIEYVFRIRVDVLTPPAKVVVPEVVETTFVLES